MRQEARHYELVNKRVLVASALALLPWLPVLVYDGITESRVEGANIGTGLLGLVALLPSIVLPMRYWRRTSDRSGSGSTE